MRRRTRCWGTKSSAQSECICLKMQAPKQKQCTARAIHFAALHCAAGCGGRAVLLLVGYTRGACVSVVPRDRPSFVASLLVLVLRRKKHCPVPNAYDSVERHFACSVLPGRAFERMLFLVSWRLGGPVHEVVPASVWFPVCRVMSFVGACVHVDVTRVVSLYLAPIRLVWKMRRMLSITYTPVQTADSACHACVRACVCGRYPRVEDRLKSLKKTAAIGRSSRLSSEEAQTTGSSYYST